jgi:hypothetical protein
VPEDEGGLGDLHPHRQLPESERGVG